ncbi:MAG: hypothetical protein QN178_12390 [Armatimonadota bacterium]|nr:hypothetical protein [Armatimonadota bacterium]
MPAPSLAHIGETVFASIPQPVGVAATPGRLLVTAPLCGNPRQVLSLDSNGAISVLAVLPSRPSGCFEDYIAIAGPADPSQPGFPSPTKGGFPSNFAYVVQGTNIVAVSPSGTVTPFTTVPGCEASRNGITFDDVGTFNYRMIVTCAGGRVWKIAADGSRTLIADVASALGLASVRIENPDVAPLSFSPYGGHVFVAAELLGKVLAISPDGVVKIVASWPGAEGVHFVPELKCNVGASGGTFFTAIKATPSTPGRINRFPLTAFSGLSGRAVVTSETGAGIGLLTPTGNPTISPTLFHASIGKHDGSAFADCTVPLLIKIIVKPGSIPHTINPQSEGRVPVAILSSPIFNALTDPVLSSITFGLTGTEHSIVSCNTSGQDVNGDGLLDRICHGDTKKLGIPSPGVYRGPLILKLFYNAPGGDPAGEGSD